MSPLELAGRALKAKVYELLTSVDIETALEELCRFPARRVINPLFTFLYNNDEQTRWRAVTAVGSVVSKLADEDAESARVIIRRLMWNLNDESGGIGWGSPEAMGEILASNEALANEYARILISYAREDGNFQEHECMQRGVLWGIGRLSQVRPELVKNAAKSLIQYLKSPDASVRGLAAWIMGLLGVDEALSDLGRLTQDETVIQIYMKRGLIKRRVKELAEEAIRSIPGD